MTISPSVLDAMVAAGCTPEQIVAAVKADAQAEEAVAQRKREADAARKRRQREGNKEMSAMSRGQAVTAQDNADTLSPFEVSPAPLPKTPNPIPPSPPKGGSSPAVFEAMWELYPNKVGKPKAQAAFVKALNRAPADRIVAGLRRYVAKTDDRPWCNLATWLNQDRWDDQPATVTPLARGSPAKFTVPSTADAFQFLGKSFADERSRREDSERIRQVVPDLPAIAARR